MMGAGLQGEGVTLHGSMNPVTTDLAGHSGAGEDRGDSAAAALGSTRRLSSSQTVDLGHCTPGSLAGHPGAQVSGA